MSPTAAISKINGGILYLIDDLGGLTPSVKESEYLNEYNRVLNSKNKNILTLDLSGAKNKDELFNKLTAK